MLFHTWEFAAFFLVVFSVYLLLRRTRFWLHWLLVASYFFYAWWNPLYLFLLLYSTTVDYIAVVLMERKAQYKKLWLALSMVNNLLLLGFFKYAGFVTDNINAVLKSFGMDLLPAPDILLPFGISFYTFVAMSYAIDYYRGKIPREPSFVRYATFVALFPHLVAGPIVRAADLLPQLRTNKPPVTRERIVEGVSLFFIGLFKKVALADFLAIYVNQMYNAPNEASGFSLLVATFAFAWQIYFDFSGYTDMARGVAHAMGFDFMINFNRPYLATGLGDFWNRWHISLSHWFRDNVYFSLGGNRKGNLRTYINMAATMLVSGLWHGANWTFVIWGALHAIGRILTRELERTYFYMKYVPTFVKQLLVFAFVCFTWIFFRAGSFGDAKLIIGKIFTSGFTDPRCPLVVLVMVGIVWAYQFITESKAKRVLELEPVKVAFALGMLLWLLFSYGPGAQQDFIYFQF